MGAVLARHNFMERQAGPRMFTAVLIFGLANLGFGLSGSFALSFLYLAILGAADTASVVVRMTLVQAETPDELRGRVAAVSSLFTQFSNEIGQFRAGTMAGLDRRGAGDHLRRRRRDRHRADLAALVPRPRHAATTSCRRGSSVRPSGSDDPTPGGISFPFCDRASRTGLDGKHLNLASQPVGDEHPERARGDFACRALRRDRERVLARRVGARGVVDAGAGHLRAVHLPETLNCTVVDCPSRNCTAPFFGGLRDLDLRRRQRPAGVVERGHDEHARRPVRHRADHARRRLLRDGDRDRAGEAAAQRASSTPNAQNGASSVLRQVSCSG